jgi:O-antigen ligase
MDCLYVKRGLPAARQLAYDCRADISGGAVNKLSIRELNPTWITILPVTALVGLLAVREQLGIHADPLRVIVLFLFGLFALALVTKYPAAFLAPVLFFPRLKEVPALNGMGPAEDWTALQLLVGLLATGILFRWLRLDTTGVSIENRLWAGTGKGNPVAYAFSSRRSSQAFLAFSLFVAVIFVSNLYTISPHYGATKLTGFLTLGCPLFIAPFVLFTGDSDLRDFILGTVLFGMAVALSSLGFSATGAMGADANPTHIGKGQAIGLAIVLLLYLPTKDRRLRALILLVCIPWLALGLASAETRGPLFSLMLVITLGFFVRSMRWPMISRRQMFLVVLAVIGAVLVLSTFWFYGEEASKFRYKSAEILALIQGSGEARGTAVQRLGYYQEALSAWLQHPWFGWGLGGWSMVYWQTDYRLYPHNIVLELLVEQGLAGAFAFLFLLTSVLRRLRAVTVEGRAHLPFLLPGLVYLVLIAMFSGDLDDSRFVWFWCGLILAGCELAQRSEQSTPANRLSTRTSLASAGD